MRKLVVLLLTALLGLAACGSDDKTENASDTGDAVTTEAPDSKGGDDAYCGLSARYVGLDKAFQPGGDAASLKATLETAEDALNDAVKVAPSEIKADVKVIADAYGPFIQALAKANYDFTKVNPEDPAFTKIQGPEVAAAGERIANWGTEHCAG